MAVPNPVLVPNAVPKPVDVVVLCGCWDPNRLVVPAVAPNPPTDGVVLCPKRPVLAGCAAVLPNKLPVVPKPEGLAAACPKVVACPNALVVEPKSPPGVKEDNPGKIKRKPRNLINFVNRDVLVFHE